MFNVAWRYASKDQRLLVGGITPEAIARSHRDYLAGPVVYGAAAVIPFIEPYVSMGIYAALAVYWLLPRTGPRAEFVQPDRSGTTS
jgi:hypothetical protein